MPIFPPNLSDITPDTRAGAASLPFTPVLGDGITSLHQTRKLPRASTEAGLQIIHFIARAKRLYERDDLPEALAVIRTALGLLASGGSVAEGGGPDGSDLIPTAMAARLLRIKILGELGQWQNMGDELRRTDPSVMDVQQKAELALGWAAYSSGTGADRLAKEWITTARQLAEAADQPSVGIRPGRRCELWLHLAETAMMAAPSLVPELLGHIGLFEPNMPPTLAARFLWLRCRWQNSSEQTRGLYRPDYLKQFVAACERDGLVGLLARAVRQEPDIFIKGMSHGISSSLYPVFFPPLSEANLASLGEVATDGDHAGPVRMTAFQIISRQPAHEVALTTAEALAGQAETGDLRALSRDFLKQSETGRLNNPVTPNCIAVQSFGGFQMTYRGRDISDDWRIKAKLLLLLLMFQGSPPLRRGQAQDMLWPDLEQSAQSNNLRVTLHWLRRALGAINGTPAAAGSNGSGAPNPVGPFLEIKASRSTITLSGAENVAWDVRLFDELTAAGRRLRRDGKTEAAISSFRRAVGLYKGTLLPHRAFEGFFDLERSHYHRLAHETMVDLAELYLNSDNPSAALEITDRAILMEPLHEATWSLAIRSHLAMGFPGRAKEAYETFGSLVHKELGVRPGPELQKLITR